MVNFWFSAHVAWDIADDRYRCIGRSGYTEWPKKPAHFVLYALTSSNIDRFQTQEINNRKQRVYCLKVTVEYCSFYIKCSMYPRCFWTTHS